MSMLRVAFLGCGGIMGLHARRLKDNPDCQIVALCDVAEEGVKAFADKALEGYQPTPAIFTDPAKMYQDAKPDAVVIATPHTMHFDHGMQALDAGCHVLMEKPMVTSAQHAHELAAKAKEAGKIVVVGYNTPCTPNFQYVRETIRKGTLGKLELVSGFLSQGWMKATAGTWRQKPELSGGGQAYDSGAHLLNSLVWSVESPVAEVFAWTDNHGTPVDINSVINVKFESGVMASIAVGGNCPGAGKFMAFMFENGRIEVDGWGGSWIKVTGADGKPIEPGIQGEAGDPDTNFIDAILGKAEPGTNPVNGINQSELMDAIYESAETGQVARPKSRAATSA